jgi:hypothetical protein
MQLTLVSKNETNGCKLLTVKMEQKMQTLDSKNGTNECKLFATLVSKNGTYEFKLLTVKMEQMTANSCQ